MNEVDNTMLLPKVTDNLFSKAIGKCHYRRCDEAIYQYDGIEFNGYLYCSTQCLGDELLKEGLAVDLSRK